MIKALQVKSKLAIIVALSGWLLFLAFILSDYYEYGVKCIGHFFSPSNSKLYFIHLFILSTPIGSTITGYLINERNRLLEAVKTSEEKYRDLYENAPDGYHSLDPVGVVLEVNETWLRMLGYERQQVEGRIRLTEILTPEGTKTFEKTFPVLKEKGSINNIEFDFKKKDGNLLPVLINATALYDSKGNFVMSRSIVRDNAVKKGYQEILRNASEEWRATFDAMPLGVMLLDSEFDIVRTNRYIADIAGLSLKDLVSQKCYRVLHRQDRPANGCALLRAIELQKAQAFEYCDTESGKYFSENVTPVFDNEGAAIAYVHSLIDITGIKKNEKRLADSRNAFFNMLRDTTAAFAELKELNNAFILAFANAIDAKSPWTKGHSERVMNYAIAIAKEIGLKEADIETLKTAALLHDIGKIGTYDAILDKPGKLTDEEFALVKMHPAKGEEILEPVKRLARMLPAIRSQQLVPTPTPGNELYHILPIIRYHHERVDGRGYPDGLKGDKIPLLAKVLCVADSFDSMTADRPYRPAPGKEYAISELKKCSGTQFDPEVVDVFLRIMETN